MRKLRFCKHAAVFLASRAFGGLTPASDDLLQSTLPEEVRGLSGSRNQVTGIESCTGTGNLEDMGSDVALESRRRLSVAFDPDS